jgi:hypothetical protein
MRVGGSQTAGRSPGYQPAGSVHGPAGSYLYANAPCEAFSRPLGLRVGSGEDPFGARRPSRNNDLRPPANAEQRAETVDRLSMSRPPHRGRRRGSATTGSSRNNSRSNLSSPSLSASTDRERGVDSLRCYHARVVSRADAFRCIANLTEPWYGGVAQNSAGLARYSRSRDA